MAHDGGGRKAPFVYSGKFGLTAGLKCARVSGMEAIRKLVDELKDELENIGMYLEHVNIASDREVEDQEEGVTPDIRELMEKGEAQFVIMADFALNEVAFSDRILNPEAHKDETEFKTAMPSEAEVTAESVKDKLRKRKK